METEETLPAEQKSHPLRYRWGAWISALSLIAAIVAWCAMVFSEYWSISLGVLAVVMAIVACCMTRSGIWRDIAITTLVAAGVLLLVFALFFFGLDMVVRSL